MVGTSQPSCLSVSNTEWCRNHHRMKPLGWKKRIDLPHHATSRISGALGQNKPFLHYVGWRVRKYPAVGEVFFLTSPFIELHRWDEKAGLQRDAIRSQCSTCSRHKEKETGL
jgi:hypothetical protein